MDYAKPCCRMYIMLILIYSTCSLQRLDTPYSMTPRKKKTIVDPVVTTRSIDLRVALFHNTANHERQMSRNPTSSTANHIGESLKARNGIHASISLKSQNSPSGQRFNLTAHLSRLS